MSSASEVTAKCLAVLVNAEAVPEGFAIVMVIVQTRTPDGQTSRTGASVAIYPPASSVASACDVLELVTRNMRANPGAASVLKTNEDGDGWEVPPEPVLQ